MIDPCQPVPQDKAWLPEAAWRARHDELLAQRQKNPDPRVIFLGDSITAAWTAEWNVDEQKRSLFEQFFGIYRPLNLGIGGDETQHVLWRLEHGEIAGLKPAVVVLLIGTNIATHRQPDGAGRTESRADAAEPGSPCKDSAPGGFPARPHRG
jgi:beta-glucosidase